MLVLVASCHATAPPFETVEATAPEVYTAQDRPRIVEVVAGPESTCARDARGRVACLGHGMAYDEEDPAEDTHVPQAVPIPASKGISAGDGFACSVDRDGGRVRCWGANGAGQLGRKTARLVDQRPAEVPDLAGVERIVSHGRRTCAVADGQLWCWPGRKDPSPRLLPLDGRSIERALYDHVRSGKALQFSYGHAHVEHPWREGLPVRCPFVDPGAPELLEDDLFDPPEGYACGGEATIEVGPGVEVGKDHAFRLQHGAIRCEGHDTVGQAPAEMPNFGAQVLDIAVGSEHTCALIAEGELRCWGSSTRGQLGIPPVHSRPPALARTDVDKLWLTKTRTCVQTDDGATLCTGESRDPCSAPAFTPLRGPTEIREVFEAAGDDSCLVDGDGSVWCEDERGWALAVAASAFPGPSTSRSLYGTGWDGWLCWLADAIPTCAGWQAPIGDVPEVQEDRLHTETPFGDSRAASLRWYGELLCALDHSGTVQCKASPTPSRGMPWADAKVPEGKVAHFTDAGWIYEDGSLLRVWGNDDQPGKGPSLRSLPAEFPKGTRVAQASRECAVTEDGRLLCDDDVPLPKGPFETVASGRHHTCALDTEHGLWCWGDATGGRLGPGDAVCTRIPRSLSEDFYDAWKATP